MSMLRTNMRPLRIEEKLAMSIRYVAGGSVHDIRLLFGVSYSFFYSTIWEVMLALTSVPELSMHFPSSPGEYETSKNEFTRKSSGGVIDGCIGCIDGFLCLIRTPSRKQVDCVRSYFNGHYQVCLSCLSSCVFCFFYFLILIHLFLPLRLMG
jgi:hypothetical protein